MFCNFVQKVSAVMLSILYIFHVFLFSAEGIAQGGYLQKYPLEMMGPGAEDRTEDVANTIVPHQTSYYDPPKHLFQPGVEKTQGEWGGGDGLAHALLSSDLGVNLEVL